MMAEGCYLCTRKPLLTLMPWLKLKGANSQFSCIFLSVFKHLGSFCCYSCTEYNGFHIAGSVHSQATGELLQLTAVRPHICS